MNNEFDCITLEETEWFAAATMLCWLIWNLFQFYIDRIFNTCWRWVIVILLNTNVFIDYTNIVSEFSRF